MRAAQTSAFRNPLDYAMGSIARTRVLRMLATHGGFVGAPELARVARVDPVSVRSALRLLEELGLVETQGGPRSRLYRLDPRDRLNQPIRQLFRKEAERWSHVEQKLRSAVREIAPPPLAAWLFGSSARSDDLPNSDIDVMLISANGELDTQLQQFRDQLWKVRLGLAGRVNPTGMTAEELMSLSKRNTRTWDNLRREAIPLLGHAPEEVVRALKRGSR